MIDASKPPTMSPSGRESAAGACPPVDVPPPWAGDLRRALAWRALVFAALLGCASFAFAAAPGAGWHAVAAGGGRASGGGYDANGTVGQAAAGPLQAGGLRSGDGYWPGVGRAPGAAADNVFADGYE